MIPTPFLPRRIGSLPRTRTIIWMHPVTRSSLPDTIFSAERVAPVVVVTVRIELFLKAGRRLEKSWVCLVVTEFILKKEQWIPRPLAKVFPFFSEARNLEMLTPPWLKFEVLTPAPIVMRPGTLIDYRIRIHGLPIRWRTAIVAWEPPHA